jgi:sugar/nucleoside kinase (ribokinase family)
MPVSTSSSPVDVVGVGANSVDVVSRLPDWPEPRGPRSKLRITEQTVCCGGQTATALATCARLGLSVRYVGATGSDERGSRIRTELARLGFDLSFVVTREALNQYALILLGAATGERVVLWDRDERLRLTRDEIPIHAIATARLVHVDDVDEEAALAAARLAREAGLPVTSDLDRVTHRTRELVEAISVPIFAEHVPPALTGIDDPEGALRSLRARHDGLLVVTLGIDGAAALDGDRFVHVPAFRVETVDTTGAGDVFRGAFIYGRLRDWPVGRILAFANAAAAVSCTRLGALNGVPSLEEVVGLLEAARRDQR